MQHSREILQVSESQADVLFIEIQSGETVASRRIQSKVALLAPVLLVATHGLAYSTQTFPHLVDLPMVENEDGRAFLLYGSEFHEGSRAGSKSTEIYFVLISSMKNRHRIRTI